LPLDSDESKGQSGPFKLATVSTVLKKIKQKKNQGKLYKNTDNKCLPFLSNINEK